MEWIYKVTNQISSMNEAEMQNNAQIIYSKLISYGWSLNAICGVLGNMTVESKLNPAQTQNGYPTTSSNGGYGLVQWTPASKYKTWAINNGYDITDGNAQLYDLSYQAHGTEYIKKSMYPLTYSEFKISLETPAYLAEVFLKNYERAGVEHLNDRIQWADYWYDYLTNLGYLNTDIETSEPIILPSEPSIPPKPDKHYIPSNGMPIWMMIKYY